MYFLLFDIHFKFLSKRVSKLISLFYQLLFLQKHVCERLVKFASVYCISLYGIYTQSIIILKYQLMVRFQRFQLLSKLLII